ncbi:MAG: hypothetical protein AAF216_07135 [Pseudomonadota bacterium]
MYDARKSGPQFSGNGIFALAILAVVAIAFALVWVFAAPSPGSGGALKLHANVPVTLAEKMPSRDETRFLNAMARLQPAALAPLDHALTRDAADREAQIKSINDAAGIAVFANISSLGHISTEDLNGMLDTMIMQVTSAQRQGSPLCNGRSWLQFENKSVEQVESWMATNGYSYAAMYDDSMVATADFMEALARAKSNPTRHGNFRNSDQKALEAAMMGLMTNPDLMQLAASGGSDRQQLARTNVCAVTKTLLQTARDLPDGTKGRAWAAAFDRPEFGQALDQLQKFGF